MGVLAVAALAASSLAVDNAVARDHGSGGARGGTASVSHGSGIQSFGGRTSSSSLSQRGLAASPNFQANRNVDHRHHHHGRNFAFGVVPFGVYNDYAYDYDYDCYQVRRVWTSYGWHLRRIDVCNYPYAW
jgi:hypothetical protein